MTRTLDVYLHDRLAGDNGYRFSLAGAQGEVQFYLEK